MSTNKAIHIITDTVDGIRAGMSANQIASTTTDDVGRSVEVGDLVHRSGSKFYNTPSNVEIDASTGVATLKTIKVADGAESDEAAAVGQLATKYLDNANATQLQDYINIGFTNFKIGGSLTVDSEVIFKSGQTYTFDGELFIIQEGATLTTDGTNAQMYIKSRVYLSAGTGAITIRNFNTFEIHNTLYSVSGPDIDLDINGQIYVETIGLVSPTYDEMSINLTTGLHFYYQYNRASVIKDAGVISTGSHQSDWLRPRQGLQSVTDAGDSTATDVTLAGVTIRDNLDMTNGKILNVQNGTASTDGVNLAQMESGDGVVQGNLNSHIGDKNNPHDVTKAQVGLGSVDNTSDIWKPVSTAQGEAIGVVQSNLDYHEGLPNPHGIAKGTVGLGNVDNTSDMSKPVSTAQGAAIGVVQSNLDTHEGEGNPHSISLQKAMEVGDGISDISLRIANDNGVGFYSPNTSASATLNTEGDGNGRVLLADKNGRFTSIIAEPHDVMGAKFVIEAREMRINSPLITTAATTTDDALTILNNPKALVSVEAVGEYELCDHVLNPGSYVDIVPPTVKGAIRSGMLSIVGAVSTDGNFFHSQLIHYSNFSFSAYNNLTVMSSQKGKTDVNITVDVSYNNEQIRVTNTSTYSLSVVAKFLGH